MFKDWKANMAEITAWERRWLKIDRTPERGQ